MSPDALQALQWQWPRYRAHLSARVLARDRGHSGPHSIAATEPANPIPIAPPPLHGLARASFVELRYFAVLSPAFHGIVGLALVNPERRFQRIAEGGLLLIIAGVVDRPRLPSSVAAANPSGPLLAAETAELC
ncbi:MAG: hypothetical protein K9L65_14465 [Chromatiaceae bacterium]|nr:hypothetical protein [Chromatiaceae bacterium]